MLMVNAVVETADTSMAVVRFIEAFVEGLDLARKG
jgi:hypothetical protein